MVGRGASRLGDEGRQAVKVLLVGRRTGPKGAGRIFKISYTDPSAPQPVAAWAPSATQIRVAFDKPIDPSVVSLPPTIEVGQYVRAADRIETLKPPYKVVTDQMLTPTTRLNVTAERLARDGTTLILRTDRLPYRNATYAVAIPGVRALPPASTPSAPRSSMTRLRSSRHRRRRRKSDARPPCQSPAARLHRRP